jgi:hypothetical protein
MANEFIARKGLIVLTNGAKITGSLDVLGDINATGYNVTASNLALLGSASIDGDITIGGNLTVGNADVDVIKFLAEVSSSILPDVNNAFDLGSGSKAWKDLYVSGTAYIGTVQATNINLDSITVLNNLTVDGNTTLGNASTDVVNITGSLISSGSSKFIGNTQLTGSLNVTSGITGSLQGTSSWAQNAVTASYIAGNIDIPDGLDVTGSLSVSGSIITTGSIKVTQGISAASFSGSFSGSGAQITNIPNSGLDNDSITVTAGSGLTDGGTVALGSSVTVSLDTGSATFTDGVKKKLDTDGVVSSSVQIDVRQTTGIATIATTGSNTFTGVQTISNTTDSTNFADGALIVQGGVGITKNVNISGSLTVEGLLTAVSMSTQYVTSSQYTIGASRVIVNDDDLVRFAGLSVVDSGSTAATGSILWDSLKNHWIYEREDGGPYKSAIVIAGPKNYGNVGDEEELVVGRVPVATGGDHIDTNAASSSIYIDFADRRTYVEAGLYVTGSVTSSVGFSGDGSQLTGIVTNLNLTGSEGGTGTVSLKTQALTIDGENGVAATVSGQTITISGSNATTTVRGVAAFTGSNFAVNGGIVSSNPINFNGADINLGGTHSFGLQNITPYGASTTDQVSLQGGAIINGVLFTSASNSDVDTGTVVIASVDATTYDASFFDYVIKKGNNYRAGTVMTVWNTAQGTTEFTDFSTNDLGNTTDVVFTVDLLLNTARLKATVASDNWIIKAAVRAM